MATKKETGSKEEKCISCLCLVKYLFSPVILIFMSFRIYVLGAAFAYVERLGRGVFCGLCVCANCTYKDRRFPRDHRSIGSFKGKSGTALDKEVTWRRIGEICAVAAPPQPKAKGAPSGSKPNASARLFSEGIEPSDICQGSLGDCWLMSALACLACQQGAIQQVFLTREYNMYGRYKVRLYDGIKRRWRTVVVDDYIPCGLGGLDGEQGQRSIRQQLVRA
ncbi:Calpain-D [Tetrabaena socialis]|uniref:Calpain-D n=1 Tax=Tetrabaena socialis TaxID=47790 RepID=A0A2J7ZUJ7_9CHLO|nr:Calpain-D [Tetrabaena socialis]|eukprot:PNH03947.1 Calpain-D [Tetrabaena socialis]